MTATRGLDPMPSTASLLKLYEERTGRVLPKDPTLAAVAIAERPGLPITWPVRITIPWSKLVSDNQKYEATIQGGKPVIVLSKKYREAKNWIRLIIRRELDVVELATDPVTLEARVFLPDRRPHDVANFAKLVHDALEKTVLANDRWLYDVRWIRAGVDVDRPRAEITLSLIPETLIPE